MIPDRLPMQRRCDVVMHWRVHWDIERRIYQGRLAAARRDGAKDAAAILLLAAGATFLFYCILTGF